MCPNRCIQVLEQFVSNITVQYVEHNQNATETTYNSTNYPSWNCPDWFNFMNSLYSQPDRNNPTIWSQQ